jgi:two-component system sensor histidine kinase SenX3
VKLWPSTHEDLGPALEEYRALALDATADRERVALAVASADVGIVVVDAQGREVVRSLGAERFRAARHADALAHEVIERLLRGALAGEEAEEELSLFGPPRETLVVLGVPLRNTSMEIVGAAAYVRDITELRRVESVRRDFVANVSHELKTPIGAMALLAETFQATDDLEVGRRLAAQLHREAERLARIVDDLLDLSEVEAHQRTARDRVPVARVVAEAVDRVRPHALARDIPLAVADDGGDEVVLGDVRQLVGALTNLLDNAVKYSDAGEVVEVGVTVGEDRLVIGVRDHGIGIPSRDLERIFERFYRVDPARSRATGGTGLGLAIVRHVAQAHGGEVTVESIEGQGSVFRLSLPRVVEGP